MFVTAPSNVGKITSNQTFFIDKVWFHLHQKVNSRTTNAVIYTIWCMVHTEVATGQIFFRNNYERYTDHIFNRFSKPFTDE